jgi:hypothetical protein
VQKEGSRSFLKVLFTKDQRISRIEEYHRRISTAVTSFQASRSLTALSAAMTGTNRYLGYLTFMLGMRRMTTQERLINDS